MQAGGARIAGWDFPGRLIAFLYYTSPSSIKETVKVGQLFQMRSLKRSLSIRAKVSLARVAESVR